MIFNTALPLDREQYRRPERFGFHRLADEVSEYGHHPMEGTVGSVRRFGVVLFLDRSVGFPIDCGIGFPLFVTLFGEYVFILIDQLLSFSVLVLDRLFESDDLELEALYFGFEIIQPIDEHVAFGQQSLNFSLEEDGLEELNPRLERNWTIGPGCLIGD